jgi:hypothetical protein
VVASDGIEPPTPDFQGHYLAALRHQRFHFQPNKLRTMIEHDRMSFESFRGQFLV